MLIAVVGTRGFPNVSGGVERHCEELYPRIAAHGDEVVVFGRSAYVREEIEWRGVRVVPLPAPASRSAEAIVHTLRGVLAARKLRPDILHVHSVGPASLVPLARVSGMPTVLTVHAPDYLQSKWGRVGRSYLRMGEAIGVTTASATIAVSRHLAAVLSDRYRRPVVHIPNGPSGVCPHPPGRLLDEFGLAPRSYALFVGRLIPDKRVEDLVAASVAGKPIPLVIVGDSSHTDRYAESVRSSCGSNVRLAGHRSGEELAELYSNAGVFALPSAVEGLSVSLLEAMAYGLPCVASDIPGNDEVLDGGRFGRLCGVGDVAALREALDEALALGTAEREGIAARLGERVSDVYGWERIAERTREVYEAVRRGGTLLVGEPPAA